MTPTLAQVLALWVKLYPSKNSAGPVLDPKIDNNRQPCRSPWARHSKPSFYQPSTRNPLCKSHKGRSPKTLQMYLVKMFLLLHDESENRGFFFMLSGPNINQVLFLTQVLPAWHLFVALALKVGLHHLFCFPGGKSPSVFAIVWWLATSSITLCFFRCLLWRKIHLFQWFDLL